MTHDVQPWWDTIDDPPAVALAKRLANLFTALQPDQMVLPYTPQMIAVPGQPGGVAVVRPGDLAPLWTCYLGVARSAITVQQDMAVEAELGPIADTIATPKDPDQLWREERGLDDGAETE